MSEPRIPAGWTSAKLPDLISPDGVLSDGDWVESKDQDPEGNVRLTQLADIGDGHWRDRSSRFLTKEKSRELRCTTLRRGDVLIARMPDPLGRSCLFPGDPLDSVTVVDVCIVRPNNESISPKWLSHFINSPEFRGAIAQLQSGSTRKRISRRNLCKIELPVPPTGEQHRIVEALDSYLSRLDEATATLERVQRNLERYRASVLKSAVEGRLVPTEAELARAEGRDYEPASVLLERIRAERRRRWERAELAKMEAKGKAPKNDKWKAKYKEPAVPAVDELPELPEGWSWATLDQLTFFTVDYRGKTPPKSAEGSPCISAANIKEGKLTFGKATYVSQETYDIYSVRGIAAPGDLLVTTEAPVGEVAIYPSTGTYLLTRRVIAFQTSHVLNQYLAHAFSSQVVNNHLRRHNRGTTVPRILKPALLSTPIPIPPLAEQSRVVYMVERHLSTQGNVRASMARICNHVTRLRQSILKWAFEGKLVDQDPDDEPASALLDRIRAEREASKPKRRKKSTKS